MRCAIVRTLSCLFIVGFLFVNAYAEDDAIDLANRLTREGKTDEAIQVLEEHTKSNPDDGLAWSLLASAYHSKGDYERAVEFNRLAANSPHMRPSARYNEACALAIIGRVDEAHEALQDAIDSGFVDYDLIASDGDLEPVRAKYKIDFPPEHAYEWITARNSVKLGYKVLLPSGYDSNKHYPAAVLFPPGPGPRSTDWAMQQLLGEGDDTRGWIIIYAIGPDRGWFTHPSHHALNEMLKMLQDQYKIADGEFHVAGFGDGAGVAATYSRMSSEYFRSLTTYSGWHWRRWDQEELGRQFEGIPVLMVVGRKDAFGFAMNEKARDAMSAHGVNVTLVAIESDDYMLASLRHGRLLEYLPKDR